MTLETTLTEMPDYVYSLAVLAIGVIIFAFRHYYPVFLTIIKDGDIDAEDIATIVSEMDTGTIATIVKKLSSTGAGLDAIYNMSNMSDTELKSFVNAMLELGAATSDERDTVINALANGKAADMDYIFENVDVAALKVLVTAFKQLDMTSMWTGKDPTATMKENLYQAVKTALTQSNGELAALAALAAAGTTTTTSSA